ncbi:Hydrolase, putative [Theobroma cacao]|uniref:Hydrolase, putative n=1 Tax=Theobroma cacao TaxID=3641 RepID=A0A061FT25_THECC|nr:Hydrolase, putative [Theobroma cacao]
MDKYTLQIIHTTDKPRVPHGQQPTVNVYASVIDAKHANTLVRRLNQIAPLENLRHVKRIQRMHLQVQGGSPELSVILCLACENETQSNSMPLEVQEIVNSYNLCPFIIKWVIQYKGVLKCVDNNEQ